MLRQWKKMACICNVYIMHFKIAWNVSKLIVFFIYLKYWWHLKCMCNGFTHEHVLHALFWCLSNKGKEFVTALPPQFSYRDNSHFSLCWLEWLCRMSLYIPTWLPWNCTGWAFMQQNQAPRCLRRATLLWYDFAAIRYTIVSQVVISVIMFKFQQDKFQSGRASQIPWVTGKFA